MPREDRHLRRSARGFKQRLEELFDFFRWDVCPHPIAEGFGMPMFHDDYPFTNRSICGKCVNSCDAK